ncbi:MAG TPA: glycosyltransferase family 4 protein [Candidatus Paceibacterota bacterium]|nr:glycosyltransferase family 4 protein [Candidatus Paceibacterota bacterium]
MKSLVLYAYPPETDGLSLQGDMLYRGMKANGEEVMPCHWLASFQKEWLYETFKPQFALGIGFWGYTPDLILHPQKFGVTPVPWFVADGWVANYQELLGSLPLVFVTSDWVRRTYQRDGVDTKNFVTAHIGVEPELFRPIAKTDPAIQKLRSMWGVKPNEKVILTMGGDVTSKGAQEVFRALAKIGTRFENWKYICKAWDEEDERDHAEEELRLIEELGLPKEKILFLSGSWSREFIPYALSATDVYAAPSRLDGYGMIQVEAQACGTPVVSINEMGPKETVLHGKTGFLANVAETVDLESEIIYPEMGFKKQGRIVFDEPKTFAYRANTDELAEYLYTLLADDEKRLQMGQAARVHAVANFDYRNLARQMTNTIKERLHLL